MYNVAFTGIVLVLIFQTVDLDQISKIVLQSVGVLWGSFFCSFAFVLPRLLAVAKSKGRGRQASKTWMDSSNGHQILISSHDMAESTTLQHPSLQIPTSPANPLTDARRQLEFLQISSESSSNYKSDNGSDDDDGSDDENSKFEGLLTCLPETFLINTSTTDAFVVSSNKSYNDSENRVEPDQADANSPNACVLVSQNGSTPLTVAHDSLEYSSTSHMCLDQTETQGKNKENVSNEIDVILGSIAVSHSLSSPVANITKEGDFSEKNLTSNSIVETGTLSSSNSPNIEECMSFL